VNLPALGCQAFALQGQIHNALRRQQRAYNAYRRAVGLLERLRESIHGEELKISFMKNRAEIYEGIVALCLKRSRGAKVVQEIFQYIQCAKSRTLVDVLSRSGSATWLAPQDESGLANKIRDLREELNWYFHKVEIAQLQQESPHRLSELRLEANRRERALLKLLRETAVDDPASERSLAKALDTDQIRQSLGGDTTILEYFHANNEILVLLMTSDVLSVIRLGEISQVLKLLDLLQLQMAKIRLGSEYVTAFAPALLKSTQSHLENLYKILIAPVVSSLNGSHLVIAPHGRLHTLPFQALFDGHEYLIDRFTISYAPSASVYALCCRRSSSASNRALVLGISDASVPYVQEEVGVVAANLFDPVVLREESASANALRENGKNCRFIHIATHGYFRFDNPMFSGIRLGDSYLSLYDLYQLKLPAELIALSGCSTGLNVIAAGDELIGLLRGLIHTGAETSLLTLWDVQDESSSQLMGLFYSRLARGATKAKALQVAMRELKAQRPHPYYWAPFILAGKA
jgi:CHAT domain-containing protein